MARRLRLLRSERPRDGEAGFALVEVIVSAAVLAMVALAVLAGVDAAGRSSGREKARAVMVSLAEQDQERLRGIPAKDVTNVDSPAPVTLNGATYTITSTALYVDDATGGTDSCANSKDVASYIRITSSVTSTGFGGNSAPVKISSLVEPPVSNVDAGEGYLAVKVNDRNGTGVPGVTVHADGPNVRDADTNDAGCAVFGPVGVGTYDITFTKTGYVDDLGRSPGKLDDVAVTQGAKTVSAVKFDLAAPLSLTFETSNPKNGNTITGSSVETVTTSDSEAPSVVTYGSASSMVSSMTLNLFPFNTPYGSIYSGACDDHDPLTVVGPTYYDSGTYKGPFAAKPGVAGSLTIHQPPLWLRLRRAPSGWPNNSHYAATATVLLTSSCVDAANTPETYAMSVAPTTKSPSSEPGWLTTTPGAFDPGLPYGTYDICAKVTRWSDGTNVSTWGTLTGQVLNDPVHGFSALKEINTWGSKPATPACPS
jgi:type II secretory pathway pseudopilin PulG